ncbi:DUF998 domain-containing protein [Lactiplantibacillus sp. WILCCON 0030]|uniref:DUF998 domain-containing protein n=1 Tax=Lactiplantibacillus brownii TaxID=3069269 RepID=A0ABU1ABJ4_9LACO|nr:DUF998 domain-containing protein [Lactiplantibacillus brownii]MDQ7938331.1 DUF998 domain-containing protein [Lactiplantibacillus brownii]
MKKQDYQLTIPAEIGEHFQLKDQDSAKLIVKRGRLVVQFEESRLSIFQKRVWIWPVVMAFLASIGYYIFCLTQNIQYIKLSGDNSLATAIILIGVVMGMLLFAGFFIHDRNNPHNHFIKNIYWRNFPVIVLSFALILALVLIGAMWLLGVLFNGATFDFFTASIILFVFVIVTNFAMVYLSLIVDASLLSTVLTLVIISGVAISMAVNNQRYWWQHNLSFLGTSNASSGWGFNATLIFAALLMIALIDYLFVSLHGVFPHSRRLLVLRILLTLTAVDLGLVGVFPNNAWSHAVHDQFAIILVYLIIALIVGIRWLLPNVSKDFLYLSYGVGGALILAEILFQGIGYFSLTAFEVVGFLMAFGWLLMLLDRIETLIDTGIESTITKK